MSRRTRRAYAKQWAAARLAAGLCLRGPHPRNEDHPDPDQRGTTTLCRHHADMATRAKRKVKPHDAVTRYIRRDLERGCVVHVPVTRRQAVYLRHVRRVEGMDGPELLRRALNLYMQAGDERPVGRPRKGA